MRPALSLAYRDVESASASAIATCAVDALIAEAMLTPKPALVDRRDSGAHRDLDLDTMLRSAYALAPTFLAIARAASGAPPSQALRERLARIGRDGEASMMRATGGSNAHRSAIWIVGRLCASAASARHDDRYAPSSAQASHGTKASERYRVPGARGEARDGFPYTLRIGLPALDDARAA